MEMQRFCENRGMSGYGSALLYKDSTVDLDGLYHLLLPLETAPSVTGSVDTFDFDILTCPSKGQVEGKETLEQKDVDFLWHRDNVRKLESLQGKVIDFLVVYQDFTARAFTGTIKVRPQDAGADIMRGTFTLTPMSAQTTTILDARDLIKDTVWFTNSIASRVVVDANLETAKVDVAVETNPSDAKVEAKVYTYTDGKLVASEDKFTAVHSEGKVTITYIGAGTSVEYAMVELTASKDKYASWVTTIAVENTIKKQA